MHAADVVKYGQSTVNQAVKEFTPEQWEAVGVCGTWSVRQIVAHLASYELVLEDILSQLLGVPANGMVARYTAPDNTFNDDAVVARESLTRDAVLAELVDANARCQALLERIPAATLAQAGTIPWYGADYAVDDFIVYANYGHKREHSAQIDQYRSTLDAR